MLRVMLGGDNVDQMSRNRVVPRIEVRCAYVIYILMTQMTVVILDMDSQLQLANINGPNLLSRTPQKYEF